MHPHTWMIIFTKQLFDLEVKDQGPTKVIMVHDTPPYDHAHTYQISLTYFERQKCYGPDKKILFKKTIIWPWGQRSRSNEGHYGTRHTALWSCTHIANIIDLSRKTKMLWSGQASLRRSRRKIRLKQYVSLRSKGRHNNTFTVWRQPYENVGTQIYNISELFTTNRC